ncbi:MAG: glycosyltransferase family 4 protein [Bacteroidia bacterium]
MSPEKEKIGFIINSMGWGGLEMNTLKLAKWLTERGWNIILFTPADSKLYKEAIDSSISIKPVNSFKKHFDFINSFQIAQLLKQHGIKKIFVFDNKDLPFIFLVKSFWYHKLKVIYQQHMQIGVAKRDLIHTLRFSCINYWISPLEWLKKEVIEKTRINPNKIKVIPLGLEVEKLVNKTHTREECRKILNINPSAPLMGILGRIDPKKGQLFVIKALEKIHESNMAIELLIMGEPTINDENSKSYFAEIKKYIETHNLADKVHIRKYNKDVTLFYNAIDYFVLASQGETYGMVTIEAMLAGVPILATNSSGTPEILNYGELGLLYEPGNETDFCSKIMKLIENQYEAGQRAEKAKTVAIDKFSHIKECEQIEQLILNSI